MRPIQKGLEPLALQNYRAVPGAIYDGKDFTPVKDEIRAHLLRDQWHLCCYCLRRISKDTRPHPTKPNALTVVQMKVEHWKSQHDFPDLQLAWTNLLGTCLGGEGAPKSYQTCDTRKGEARILLNPLDLEHIATLYCTSDGRLESNHPSFQEDIDDRLGLNQVILVGERRAILDRSLARLKAKYRASEFKLGKIIRLIEALETPADGKLPEQCSVLRLWARKRFGAKL